MFSHKDIRRFDFYVPVPGLASDWYQEELVTLAAEAKIHIETEQELQTVLRALPCCTQRADGSGEGDPLNLVQLWISPIKYRGEIVIVGSVSRNIDPNVDEAVQYVVEDLVTLIHRSLHIMLFAAVASTLVGCAGQDNKTHVDVEKQAFEDLRVQIREAIDNSLREAEAIALVDALAADLHTIRDKISARKQRVRQLNANYDTTRADFVAFLGQVNTEIRAHQQRIAGNHRSLLVTATPEEWSQISKVRTKAMTAAIKSMQAI